MDETFFRILNLFENQQLKTKLLETKIYRNQVLFQAQQDELEKQVKFLQKESFSHVDHLIDTQIESILSHLYHVEREYMRSGKFRALREELKTNLAQLFLLKEKSKQYFNPEEIDNDKYFEEEEELEDDFEEIKNLNDNTYLQVETPHLYLNQKQQNFTKYSEQDDFSLSRNILPQKDPYQQLDVLPTEKHFNVPQDAYDHEYYLQRDFDKEVEEEEEEEETYESVKPEVSETDTRNLAVSEIPEEQEEEEENEKSSLSRKAIFVLDEISDFLAEDESNFEFLSKLFFQLKFFNTLEMKNALLDKTQKILLNPTQNQENNRKSPRENYESVLSREDVQTEEEKKQSRLIKEKENQGDKVSDEKFVEDFLSNILDQVLNQVE